MTGAGRLSFIGGAFCIGACQLAHAQSTGVGPAVTLDQVTDIVATTAPVQSVNGAQGMVTVPSLQRQTSTPMDATSGTVSWTFPVVFTNAPTCFASLAAANASYSFDAPIVTALTKAAVTIKLTAHPSSVTITSLALPVIIPLTVNPPAGTTLTLTCVGALP